MKLEQSFEVSAPLERVWAALIDVEHVAPCLPGAAVTGRNDDGSFNGTFKVKIGPTSAAYSGKLVMEDVDEQTHSATMNAAGTDKRGQGGAKATIVSTVSEAADGVTRVEVITDYHITGRLARFGRGGMIEEISNRLLGEFAKTLQASLTGDGDGAVGDEPAPPTTDEPRTEAEVEPETRSLEPESSSPPPHEVAPAPESSPPPPPPRPPVETEPVQGLSLVAGALLARARERPLPVTAMLLGFLLALRLRRRR